MCRSVPVCLKRKSVPRFPDSKICEFWVGAIVAPIQKRTTGPSQSGKERHRIRFPDSIFPRFRMLPRFEFPPIPRFGAFPRFPDSTTPDSKQIPIKQPVYFFCCCLKVNRLQGDGRPRRIDPPRAKTCCCCRGGSTPPAQILVLLLQLSCQAFSKVL